ncbi:hypothetical protein RSOLAG1IB_10206 [Rhizoctonia solani AG-1 IB]|uniref:Uncharacterized protein n=1 Tax=Thanatephorus cucumeris (strain AG1-IB / isolate 7/3/14) TaxID=1108050 RepID=M5BXJ7_THACB|nr:hypothetical protein BN14_06423 [Rhizoctonia solani AG-1 IB]CEL62104.1 hypothetical protein RSOLAG1IB_10206 [Rhizoctonia solani AG-1 IB]
MAISNDDESTNPVASSSKHDPKYGRVLGIPGPVPTSESLDKVWAFVQPALCHILGTATPSGEPARIDAEYYSHIYTTLYNLSTAAPNGRSVSGAAGHALAGLASLRLFSSPPSNNTGKQRDFGPPESDAVADQIDYGPYLRLEDTFRRHAQSVLDNAPGNDSQLIDYLLAQYERYNRSAAYISRLFSYLHRHFVKRMVAAGHGWLDTAPRETINQLVRSPPIRRPSERELEERIANEIKTRRLVELKKWGYTQGSNTARSREIEAMAEACAEAASPPDKIVPVVSLALRQWRIQVLEPLGADSRLSKTVLALVRRPVSDKIPEKMQRMLKSCGVRGVDPARKTLKRYLQSPK